jgi:hypothetical protein
MPCDICDHTVQSIGATDRPTYWCPRCGTLKIVTGDFHDTKPPALVERVRAAEESAMKVPKVGPPIGWMSGHHQMMGIREAVGRDPHRGEGG